jgi:glycosyltransferase involved in cell wall biosynthesis
MRILILSHYYEPEPIPKASELAQALARRGHSVSVITGFPNYPRGKLFPGFHLRLYQRETVSGVPVVRTFVYPYHGRSALGRLLNYGSFMISAVWGSFLVPACDVIYVWHPPLTVGIAAWAIACLKKAPFVYDVQDIWPESIVWAGMLKNRFLIWVLHRVEGFIYRHAKHLLVVSPGAKENLSCKGVPPEKISVASHWIDETLFSEAPDRGRDELRRQYGFGDRFVVMFAGNLGLVQGLETIVQAAARLRDQHGILFAIVGDGADRSRLQSLSRELALANIRFIDRQPLSAMPSFFAAADALLVHLKRSPLAEISIPTKTLAYLAANRPILMAVNGAAADLVQRAQAGIVFPPDEPETLAREAMRLSRMSPAERAKMGENGRSFLLANYGKETVSMV